jgi:3-deoxy-manno-octulosonate cytidylyltransferase (CMP-KDO synthetase)
MIQRVYERASSIPNISKAIVATDDRRIFDTVEGFGGNCMITSEDHQSGTDRCAEVVDNLEDYFDVVINIQGDEPSIRAKQIEEVLNLFQDDTIQIGTLAKHITKKEEIENPNVVKVVFNQKNKALYFSRSVIPHQRDLNGPTPNYFKHIGLYAFRPSILQEVSQLPQSELEKTESLEQLRWLDNGYSIGVGITESENIGIDTPEDLQKLLDKGDL